jgi:hypothetical protein
VYLEGTREYFFVLFHVSRSTDKSLTQIKIR